MTVSIDPVATQFGESYILTAVADKFHKPIVRQFFSYDDAYKLAMRLFCEKLDQDLVAAFKAKGA